MELTKIKDFFKGDRYAIYSGIDIESADENTAVCRMEISDNHLNANDVVQGGAIFTLADFTFAVAANAQEIANNGHRITVSLSSNVTFTRPAKGSYLLARATCISRGKKVSCFQVSVLDMDDREVAHVIVNGYQS